MNFIVMLRNNEVNKIKYIQNPFPDMHHQLHILALEVTDSLVQNKKWKSINNKNK